MSQVVSPYSLLKVNYNYSRGYFAEPSSPGTLRYDTAVYSSTAVTD